MNNQPQHQSRQTPQEDEPPYLPAWLDYRFRWGLLSMMWSFTIGLQFTLLICGLSPAAMALAASLPFMVISSLTLSHFRCPRCRGYFFGSRWLWDWNPTQCRQCGLPKYTLNASGSPKLTEFDSDD